MPAWRYDERREKEGQGAHSGPEPEGRMQSEMLCDESGKGVADPHTGHRGDGQQRDR